MINYLSIIFQKTCHPESVENKPNRCRFQAVQNLANVVLETKGRNVKSQFASIDRC